MVSEMTRRFTLSFSLYTVPVDFRLLLILKYLNGSEVPLNLIFSPLLVLLSVRYGPEIVPLILGMLKFCNISLKGMVSAALQQPSAKPAEFSTDKNTLQRGL
jgi:hypothetical protein